LTFCILSFLVIATSSLPVYCPTANDLVVAYGSPSITNQGWTITSGGGAATKAAFNLLGGSVEFDVDFSGVNIGVNANIYTISPTFSNPSAAFDKASNYCDGQGAAGSAQFCTEVDWIESNGNCGGATTLHTIAGGGSPGCTAWGCAASYTYGGVSSFHMKISHAADGTLTVVRNGVTISQSSMSPIPALTDLSPLVSDFTKKGAVVYSSLWSGWVPSPSGCSSASTDATGSHFTISNLKITGSVVQGPTPTLCSTGPVAPVAPVPVPVVAPVAPVSPPPTSFSSACSIAGANNNNFYYEVQSVAGATVSIKCGNGFVQSCVVSAWGDATYYQCSISNAQVCSSPVPTCLVAGPPKAPTSAPTTAPKAPTSAPTVAPKAPTAAPTAPTTAPKAPTSAPTAAPTKAPTTAPVSSTGCSAALYGTGNNAWWDAVKVSAGATSVKVTCDDSTAISSCLYAWTDSDSKPVWSCQLSKSCSNPKPSCSGPSGARLSDDQTDSAPAASLAGWMIALIALAAVFTVLFVVAVGLYVVKSSNKASYH